jgi:hypothetical protein
MSDLPLPGHAEERAAQEVLAQYDAPAYVRRARAVEAALEDLLARCRQRREAWVAMVRLRVGILRALAGNWQMLRPLLADDAQLTLLQELHEALAPRLRVAVPPAGSSRALRLALTRLQQSIGRFNERWREFLLGVDLTEINEARAGYNRYYLLEKECAVRSPAVARQGFERLPLLRIEDLVQLFPPLPCPRSS